MVILVILACSNTVHTILRRDLHIAAQRGTDVDCILDVYIDGIEGIRGITGRTCEDVIRGADICRADEGGARIISTTTVIHSHRLRMWCCTGGTASDRRCIAGNSIQSFRIAIGIKDLFVFDTFKIIATTTNFCTV